MQNTIDIAEAVGRWTRHKFNFRASFYTGHGVVSSDLNSAILEMIYQGLKTEVGQEVATNFAKFVNNLKDLSASAFIQAFEQFWYGGCKDTDFKQRPGTGNQVTGHGSEVEVEALVLVAEALFGGRRMSLEETERASRSIKQQFILEHKDEVGKSHIPSNIGSPFERW